MTHGSLFSGFGGFDLAAEWMGWENKFHCEINPFCNKTLKYYWPNAKGYTDIKSTDFSIWRGKIDILSGGFPCQPYSTAGKRKGKEDDRHLWPEMLRAIGEIQPGWVVGENVRGLTNWNGGMVFDEVQADLETKGYEVLPFLLPACSKNAPHRRDRIWFVANNNRIRCDLRGSEGLGVQRNKTLNETNSGSEIITNANIQGLEGTTRSIVQGEGFRFTGSNKHSEWQNFPTVAPVCGGDDGIPRELDGITFSKWRTESIKGYGNAIVPQVAFEIFKAIEQYEILTTN